MTNGLSTVKQEEFRHGLGTPRKIKVLLYHRVVPDDRGAAGSEFEVPVRNFRRQLQVLDRLGFTPITFVDYMLYLRGELDLPKSPIIITFDDGYEETFTCAFPVLQEFGMKAVVFVITDPHIVTNVWDKETTGTEAPLLKAQHILEMHSAGFEIGSHSLTHQRLTSLPRDACWEEISRSRMLLEIMLNAPIRTFSYPYGDLNDEVKQLASEAGYTAACAAWSGPAVFGTDRFEIRRLLIDGRMSLPGFAARVIVPYHRYRWLVWMLRRLVRWGNRPEHHIEPEKHVNAT